MEGSVKTESRIDIARKFVGLGYNRLQGSANERVAMGLTSRQGASVAAEEWHEVHAGWLNVLLPLKAWIAHGVDLRNHDPGRTWAQGYVDQ